MCFLVRCLLWIFNGVCVVVGLIVLLIGVLVHIKTRSLSSLLEGELTVVSTIFIVIGLTIIGISVLGYCGAFLDSSILLTAYASALIVVLLLQIIIGILAFVFRSKLEETIKSELERQFQRFDEYKQGLDVIQIAKECCGLFGKSRWNGTTLPLSCCGYLEIPNPVGPPTVCNAVNAFDDGCMSIVENDLDRYLSVIGYAAFVLGVVECGCIVLTWLVICDFF